MRAGQGGARAPTGPLFPLTDMRRKKNASVWLLLPVLAVLRPSAAETPPEWLPAAATADGPSVVAGQVVQFRDRSLHKPDRWEWDFEFNFLTPTIDSTEANPTWVYQEPSIYAVRLRVCNEFGCDVRIKFIEVVAGEPPDDELIFRDGFESGDTSRWEGAAWSPPPRLRRYLPPADRTLRSVLQIHAGLTDLEACP